MIEARDAFTVLQQMTDGMTGSSVTQVAKATPEECPDSKPQLESSELDGSNVQAVRPIVQGRKRQRGLGIRGYGMSMRRHGQTLSEGKGGRQNVNSPV